MVAITGLLPVFTAENEMILPEPFAAKPIPGVSLTQVKVFAVPVKLIAAVAAPFTRLWFDTAFMVGNAFTVPVTATFWLVAPGELNTTLPEIFPGDAEAADCTKIKVLFTIPPACVSVKLLLYPLPAVSDIAKPVGAVAVILPGKLLPLTINCWILGLAEAVPTQAEMSPHAVPEVIAGVCAAAFEILKIKINITNASRFNLREKLFSADRRGNKGKCVFIKQ